MAGHSQRTLGRANQPSADGVQTFFFSHVYIVVRFTKRPSVWR